jgi:hypothetical protein
MAPVTHGAYAPRRIEPTARALKRALLRRSGLNASDLSGVQAAYLDTYAVAMAKVRLVDAWLAEHGLIADGQPQPVLSFYVSALNSARNSLAKLEQSLTASQRPGRDALAAFIAERFGGEAEDED